MANWAELLKDVSTAHVHFFLFNGKDDDYMMFSGKEVPVRRCLQLEGTDGFLDIFQPQPTSKSATFHPEVKMESLHT